MRLSSSRKTEFSVARILAALLLASAAAGCSSDATRFNGIFSGDNLTTGSIPRRQITGMEGNVPTPTGNVASANGGGQPVYATGQIPAGQSYPRSYDQARNAAPSPARASATSGGIQRAELAAPQAARPREEANLSPAVSQDRQSQANVLVAPGDAAPARNAAPVAAALPAGATRVTLKRGETLATLSRRYGVPEQALLKANGLRSPAEAATGQSIIVPNSATASSPAQSAASPLALPAKRDAPMPAAPQEDKVAVLPGASSSRDKRQQASAAGEASATGAAKEGGTYVVKPGDTLTKIAAATGSSVDALKAANDIGAGSIRIGQALKLPAGANAAASDAVKTAAIPAKAEPPKAAQPAKPAAQPVVAAAPQKDSVSEVAAADPKIEAPEATGIGKYRWPARGAVISSYGENNEGKRNDGIDISVPQGTPIKAAENGVVIYAGNGLKELGNTVLVRHDDGTVTVYGHADTLSVTRGQKVQRGQQVAVSGMSGNVKRPMLHFEVRKNATPVNPMGFLE